MTVTVSIVSHGQGGMVEPLLAQLRHCPEVRRIFLTLNIPEEFVSDERVSVLRNERPMGFGANHNAAFARSESPWFCVLNPDITLAENPFPALIECLQEPDISLAAPRIVSPTGQVEESARDFPTVGSLLRRCFMRDIPVSLANPVDTARLFPDWVGGMFMLFRAERYALLKGFDERYHLYYEDVDICRRIRQQGGRVVLCPSAVAIHAAQRSSHRNLRYFYWHLSSMMRYLWRA